MTTHEPSFVLTLTRGHRLFLHLGQVFVLFLLLLLAEDWSRFTLLGKLVCGGTLVGMALGSIEALSRRYVIDDRSLTVKSCGIARVSLFVPPLRIVSTPSGQLRLCDSQGKRLATIPRGFGTASVRSALVERTPTTPS